MSYLMKFAVLGMTSVMVAGVFPMTALAADHHSEWYQKADGTWCYYDNDGNKVKYETIYCSTDSCYYVVDSKGRRVTSKGWYTLDKFITYYGDKVSFKRKFYLKEGGACVTNQWKKIKGKHYYFSPYMNTNSSYYDYENNKKYIFGDDGSCKKTGKTYFNT